MIVEATLWEVIGKHWDDQTPGVTAYEIGSPYQDKACPPGYK